MQRYEQFAEPIKVSQGTRRYSSIRYPKIELKTSDIYIVTRRGQRLDIIANQYYGDPRYWVILARSNKLYGGTIVTPPGIRLRIPYPLDPSEFNDVFSEAQF